jgi:hypothetical protein
MGGVVAHHVLHQSHQLLHGGVLALGCAGAAVRVAVVVMVVIVVVMIVMMVMIMVMMIVVMMVMVVVHSGYLLGDFSIL